MIEEEGLLTKNVVANSVRVQGNGGSGTVAGRVDGEGK